MSLDPLSRPQSVFALQKELSREGERRYTKLTLQREGAAADRQHAVTRTRRACRKAAGADDAPAHEILRLPGQPQGRPREERRPHGLLLHARVGPVRAGRRHGRPSRRRGRRRSWRCRPSRRCSSATRKPTLHGRRCASCTTAIIAGHHQIMRYATQKAHARHAAHDASSPAVLQGNAAYLGALRRLAPVRGARRQADRAHARPLLLRAAADDEPGRADGRPLQPQRAASPAWAAPASRCSTPSARCCCSPATGSCCAPTASGARVSDSEITDQLAPQPLSDAVPDLVEQALRNGGAEVRQRHRARARVGRRPTTPRRSRGISTDSIGDGVFASTIQAGVLGTDASSTTSTTPRSSARSPRSTKPSSAPPQRKKG